VYIETNHATSSSTIPDQSRDLKAFHLKLMRFGGKRLSPAMPSADWRVQLAEDAELLRLEGELMESERRKVAKIAAAAPRDAKGFVDWFTGLRDHGPGQFDPLFDWVANDADREEMRWFVQQEVAGEAGFDDLVALTQLRMPTGPKLEMARNYWDEMGRGQEAGMHGPMLNGLVDTLDLDPTIEGTVWESLALANAMTAMAATRRYAWHSVGALGAIELTAPGRSACTAAGLKRVGLSGKERRYFSLHAVLDVKHSEDWNREAIRPAVEGDPRRATAMAEGALMRLRCGERCFERYRAHFGFA
jgi:hypothetical protein